MLAKNLVLMSGPNTTDLAEKLDDIIEVLHTSRFIEIQIQKALRGEALIVPKRLTNSTVTPSQEQLDIAKLFNTVCWDILPTTPQEQSMFFNLTKGTKL